MGQIRADTKRERKKKEIKKKRKEGMLTQQAEERVISVMPFWGERKKSRDKLHPNILKTVN